MKQRKEEVATLCEEASTEHDPRRLMTLVRRILELLDGDRDSSTADESVQLRKSNKD